MIFKQRIVHFVEESSQKLKLTYQSTLHAIQIINVLDNTHSSQINKNIARNWLRAKCFGLSVLSLCLKFYEGKAIHMRDLIKLVIPRQKDQKHSELQRMSICSEDKIEAEMTAIQIESLIKDEEVKVMLNLRWKLAMPLLYDEVITIAYMWDSYVSNLTQFPLKFQSQNNNQSHLGQNHNYLVNTTRICLYNFNHLIKYTNIEHISYKIKRLGLALFVVGIKNLLKDKVKSHQYLLSPNLSIGFLLGDFLKSNFNATMENIGSQINIINEVLDNYKAFREKSKGIIAQPKKSGHKSNKHSQDKQNMLYYVNKARSKSKSKKHIENTDQRSQKYRSRSKSKKDKIKEKIKIVKSKDSITAKGNKKKSNSTKSIITKNVSSIKREKQQPELKKEKKVIKVSKSKQSDKSQLNSKLIQNYDNEFSSKSTYWLRSTILGKTDKKSTNSSIRMKIR